MIQFSQCKPQCFVSKAPILSGQFLLNFLKSKHRSLANFCKYFQSKHQSLCLILCISFGRNFPDKTELAIRSISRHMTDLCRVTADCGFAVIFSARKMNNSILKRCPGQERLTPFMKNIFLSTNGRSVRVRINTPLSKLIYLGAAVVQWSNDEKNK
jgi:hypothetical protein